MLDLFRPFSLPARSKSEFIRCRLMVSAGNLYEDRGVRGAALEVIRNFWGEQLLESSSCQMLAGCSIVPFIDFIFSWRVCPKLMLEKHCVE